MRYCNDLEAGDKVELIVERNKGDEKYLSKIEEVIDHQTFLITRPISKDSYTYLSVGEVIKVVFFREEGAYAFDARVTDRIKSGQTVSAVVSAISEKYKLQRRGFYRLGVMVPVTLQYKLDGKRIVRQSDTLDISGGGVKILCPDKINMNDIVEITISIPGVDGHIIKGKAVRSIKSPKNEKMHEIGVEFTDINPRIRQKIIQYIFIKQRSILKKGIK